MTDETTEQLRERWMRADGWIRDEGTPGWVDKELAAVSDVELVFHPQIIWAPLLERLIERYEVCPAYDGVNHSLEIADYNSEQQVINDWFIVGDTLERAVYLAALEVLRDG